MDDEEGYARLSRVVADRRVDLGRSQMEVAHIGGLSLDRVSAIERGEARNLRPKTVRALERGLDWQAGSIRAILAGGEAIPLEDRELADQGRAVDELIIEREPTAREIADRMTELANWVKADRERDRRERERERRETSEEIRTLKEEIDRLRNERSG